MIQITPQMRILVAVEAVDATKASTRSRNCVKRDCRPTLSYVAGHDMWRQLRMPTIPLH
jgi:hypothetical protein